MSKEESYGVPGGGMSSGRGDSGSDGMPGGFMSSGRGDDGSDGMPGGGMSSGRGDSGSDGGSDGGSDVSASRGSMNADGSGGDDDGGETPRSRSCATMDVHRRLLSRFHSMHRPGMKSRTWRCAMPTTRSCPAARRNSRPVVCLHVVWNTPQQNISDRQINSQIDVLNRDFRRTNPDVNNTPAPFLPLTADARVEFFLANVDPNGAPSTGINRRQTTVASFGSDDAVKSQATGGASAWPADRYLNIWVCQLGGGLLGYAQFPGGPAATDGVVILQSAFGTTGTAAPPFHLGRTATHEIGHWLNLNHIWGDDGTGCSGTDNVADTPNQAGGNIGTPTFPHVSCGNGPNGDMFMNYMDYVDDPAMFMFTAGQVTRMQACLDGPRSSIGTEAGAPRQSSSPVVAWGANRLDVFVLGTDRALYHKWWNGAAWGPSLTGYEAMGGVCTSAPQVVAWGPNRLDVFVTGTDSALYHKWWNGAAWGPSLTGYENMGGVCVGDPRIVAWGANRLDVFVLGTNRALYHKWWNGAAWGPHSPAMRTWAGCASASQKWWRGGPTASMSLWWARTEPCITNGGMVRPGGLADGLRTAGGGVHVRAAGGGVGAQPARYLCGGHGRCLVSQVVEWHGLGPLADGLRAHGWHLRGRARGGGVGAQPARYLCGGHGRCLVSQVVEWCGLGTLAHGVRGHGRGLHLKAARHGVGAEPARCLRDRHG